MKRLQESAWNTILILLSPRLKMIDFQYEKLSEEEKEKISHSDFAYIVNKVKLQEDETIHVTEEGNLIGTMSHGLDYTDNDWNHLHDVILTAQGKDVKKRIELALVFYNLPAEIKAIAQAYGMSDTEFREKAIEYLKTKI